MQEPYNSSDIKMTHSLDISMPKVAENIYAPRYTNKTSLENYEQILRNALKVTSGSMRNDPSFGASPKGRKTLMTLDGVEKLKSYVLQNLLKSGINPNQHKISVNALILSQEAIVLNIKMEIQSISGNREILTVNSIFDDSAQEVKTIIGFGV
jgi:hypothetical protein